MPGGPVYQSKPGSTSKSSTASLQNYRPPRYNTVVAQRTPAPEDRKNQEKKPPERPTPLPDTIAYEVQEGDTLWSLAKRFYNDAAKFEYIYYANRDILNDPETIKPGQELFIPYHGTLKDKEYSGVSESFYIQHFKFLIQARAFSILQNQKQYVKKLQAEYSDPEKSALIENLVKIKKVDDQLAQKESDLQWQMGKTALLEGWGGPPSNSTMAALQETQRKIDTIQALRLQLSTAYPALKTLEGKDPESSLKELQTYIAAGFEQIKADLDNAWKSISEEDINLNKLSPVVTSILKHENITKEKAAAGDKKSAAILEWLDHEDFKEKAISIGGFVVSLGLLIASGLSGGTLAPICLSVASAIVATGASAYDLEMAHDIYQVAKAGEGKLTGVENARFNMIMGIVNLTLDALSVGKALKLLQPGELIGRSAKLNKVVQSSKAMGKALSGKAENAGVLGKILNLPEKEFDLAMELIEKNSLRCIQEHHWINEVLADHELFDLYKISLHDSWNKNFIVGHIGRHSNFYRFENRKFLDDLFKTAQRENLSQDQVLLVLKNKANKLRSTVQSDPTSLYQNPEKPVLVLE